MKNRTKAALLALLAVVACHVLTYSRVSSAISITPTKGPAWSVFTYECQQFNRLGDELQCHTEGMGFKGLMLYWRVKPSSLSEERRKELLYHFNRMALRYLSFGYYSFNVSTDYYPDNQYDMCIGTIRGFRCYRYIIDADGDGIPIEKYHEAAPSAPVSKAKSTGP